MRVLLILLCGGLFACAPASGSFAFLTYNVAGLPEGASGSHPEANHPQIAPKLGRYDLVVVQEDFAYHELLDAGLALPHRTEPRPGTKRPMGDGLAFFSRFPLAAVEHVQWSDCAGVFEGANDCLAEKGFAVTTVALDEDVELLVYDLHADAGGGTEDMDARVRNYAQLGADVKTRAAGRAVVVAGDTNLKATRDKDMATLAQFLADTGLSDGCRSLQCPTETIDRVLFRSSDALELAPVSWRFADEMVDADGVQLSDHQAVNVGFTWKSLP